MRAKLSLSAKRDQIWGATVNGIPVTDTPSGKDVICPVTSSIMTDLLPNAEQVSFSTEQELLQKGKSNTEANTIVIYQLERHPIYGNYVKDLGKEALRKLLQIPKPAKEKNGK